MNLVCLVTKKYLLPKALLIAENNKTLEQYTAESKEQHSNKERWPVQPSSIKNILLGSADKQHSGCAVSVIGKSKLAIVFNNYRVVL